MAGFIVFILLVVLPLLAFATTFAPTTYAMDTYFWVVGLSVLGGLVSFNDKWKSGFFVLRTGNRKLDILVFVLLNGGWFLLELFASAFCGLMTFFICMSAKTDPELTAAFIGMSGFAGSSFLNYLLKLGKAILAKRFHVNVMDRNESHEFE